MVNPDGIDLAHGSETLRVAPADGPDPFARRSAAGADQRRAGRLHRRDSIVDAYPAFIDADLHIVTPNKRANVLPWRRYESLKARLERRQKHFLYETNVGAGLPVMSTLRDLIASGDEIVRIEGILSGTLSYLFNAFDGTVPFSALVREAHPSGSPNRIRERTCPGRTWRASCSSWRARSG